MLLYNVGVWLYAFTIRIASLFNPKAKLWVEGRKNWKSKLKSGMSGVENPIWMHCASLGEFEQGRSVIEKIKEQFPQQKILLSFFSPSGFEIRKNYDLADYVCYLPIDSKKNAFDFIDICKPKAVIFVKYEFWINYLNELHKRNIPTYLISSVFKEHQPFFKWYGGIFRKALGCYKTIFVQDKKSLNLLEGLKVKTAILNGDTRIDRVSKIKETAYENQFISQFSSGNFVIVAGSTWPKDNVLIVESFHLLKKNHPKLKLIIALHEVENKNVDALIKLLDAAKLTHVLITETNQNLKSDVLIINTIGILSLIYRYGNIAYIGGGFDNGIHNILEPSVYGLPVVFGPNHQKFIEAEEMLSLKSAVQINNSSQLTQTISTFMNDKDAYSNSSNNRISYINKGKGATDKIITEVFNIVK